MGYTLLFDCDGVLADTEPWAHLPAFNQMFAEFGLPAYWSREEYGKWLKIGGGKERLLAMLTDDFVQKAHLPTELEAQKQLVAQWHKRKTAIYIETVKSKSKSIPARPGVARIVRDALAAHWQLAVCSTGTEVAVRAVLEGVVGRADAAHFPILTGDIVPHKKPSPDIYQFALTHLHVRPEETIAIEDSRNGLLAATRAGLRCVITLSAYTHDEDMSEATIGLSDLGEPDHPMQIMSNRSQARPGSYMTLDDLVACLK